MWKVVRFLAGDINNVHYNFVVAKPLVALNLKYVIDFEIELLK